LYFFFFFFFFQAEDGIRDRTVTGVQTCALPIWWFNPFRFGAPLAWFRRNHRKSLVVDGRLGFVTGLCIAARWAGDAARGIPAWRSEERRVGKECRCRWWAYQ